jgi:hypothetical protein
MACAEKLATRLNRFRYSDINFFLLGGRSARERDETHGVAEKVSTVEDAGHRFPAFTDSNSADAAAPDSGPAPPITRVAPTEKNRQPDLAWRRARPTALHGGGLVTGLSHRCRPGSLRRMLLNLGELDGVSSGRLG